MTCLQSRHRDLRRAQELEGGVGGQDFKSLFSALSRAILLLEFYLLKLIFKRFNHLKKNQTPSRQEQGLISSVGTQPAPWPSVSVLWFDPPRPPDPGAQPGAPCERLHG